MTSCVPLATLTEFETRTTSSLSTTTSTSISTLNDVVSTIISSRCLGLGGLFNGTCILPGFTTSLQTIPGITTTLIFPVTLTVPSVITSPTKTLFSSCPSVPPTSTTSTTTSTSTSTTSSTTSTTSTSTSTSTTSTPTSTSSTTTTSSTSSNQLMTTSFATIMSTPPPFTTVSQASVTLGNGQVVGSAVTVVISPSPSIVVITTVVPQIQTDPDNGSSGRSSRIGLILGSLIGGVSLLFLLAGVFWLLRKRLRQNPWEEVFKDKATYDDVFSPDVRELRRISVPPTPIRPEKPVRLVSDEPKPYQYGVVGHIVPSFADDASSSTQPSPLPSPGLLHEPAPRSGTVTPTSPSLHPPHSPAPSSASDQPLIPRYSSPPPMPKFTNLPTIAPAPFSPTLPKAAPSRRQDHVRQSTSDSIGTPESSYIRPGHLTLANWDPTIDGLIDTTSTDDLKAKASSQTTKHDDKV